MPSLYPFQEKARDWLMSRKRAVLGSQMRLGKSATSLMAAVSARSYSTIFEPIVIICPAFLTHTWLHEADIWVPEQNSVIITGHSPNYFFGLDILIMSYEAAVTRIKAGTMPLETPILILDECHYLKNPKTARTETILKWAANIPYVWGLTGTAIPNAAIDAYHLFNWMMEGKLGTYWGFARQYCYLEKTRWGTKVYGGRNLDHLRKRVTPVFYRDTVEEVMGQLPEQIITKVPIEPKAPDTNDWLKQEREFSGEVIEAIEKGHEPSNLSYASLRKMLALSKASDSIDFIKDTIEQLDGEPLVIFGHHTDALKEISRRLSDEDIINAVITGDTTQTDRTNYVWQFQEANLKVLICSIKATGLGIRLDRASTAIFLEITYTPAELEQAMARIRSMDKKRPCSYYFLQYRNSIDQDVHNAVMAKQRVINQFLQAS